MTGVKQLNRPLPMVAQGTKDAKEDIFESRGKAAFLKAAALYRNTEYIAIRRETFWLPHLSSGSQKFFLGVLRAFSEASGSFYSRHVSAD